MIIIATLLAIHVANITNTPIVLIKADGEKAYDKAQFVTQLATAAAAGIRPLLQNLGQNYSDSEIETKVTNDIPGTVRDPQSGFSQGDATVCQRFPLTTEPAVKRAFNRCGTRDPTLKASRIDQFVDDSIIRENSIDTALAQLTAFNKDLEDLGYHLGTIEIACNRPATFWNPTQKSVTWNSRLIPLQPAIRILGACIHLVPGSQCAPHRCTICKSKSQYALCDTCESQLLQKLYEWTATPIDKAALFNSQILPATLYAPYTCEAQQLWSKKLYSAARHAITKISFGGYHAIYALHPKEGGIGLPEWQDVLTQTTVTTLARETNPCNSQGSDSITSIRKITNGHITRWPDPISTALHSTQLHLHKRLRTDTTQASSQTQSSQANVHAKYSWKLQVLTTTLEIYSNRCHPEKWTWHTSHTTQVNALATTLATATTKLKELHNTIKIYIEAPMLENLLQSYLSIHPRNRTSHQLHGYLGTLSEDATIHKPIATPQCPLQTLPPSWLNEVPVNPTTAPLYITTSEGYTSATSVTMTIKHHFLHQRHQNAMQAPQLAEVFNNREPNWSLSSLATPSMRAGTHFFTPLSQNETTTLFALRAGALTHSRNTTCSCGQPMTLQHLHTHIDQGELTNCHLQAHQLHFTSELGQLPITTTYLTGSLSTCLGWVYGNDAPINNHKNRKHLRNVIQQIISNFTRLLIKTTQQHRTASAYTTDTSITPYGPPREQQPPTYTPPDTGYVLYTDAALPGQNPHGIGLGAVLKYDNHIILEAWKYIPKSQLPPNISSTIAEYAACTFAIEEIVATTPPTSPINNLVHCMDNRAVPEQTAGDWNTNNVSTLQMTTRHRAARATARETGCILNIEMHWIPRAQNDKADRCASIAIRTRTTKTISTVSETASAWHRHNLGEGCVMSPMLQSILRDFSVQGHLDFVLLVLLEEFSDQFMLDCANAIYIFFGALYRDRGRG